MAQEMVEQNKMQKEVEIVGEIQKSLLSSNKKEPFPLAGINIPAKVISEIFIILVTWVMVNMDLA